jgi:hypothetical protein
VGKPETVRKDIIWGSRATNNQKETKQPLLCHRLFLFISGSIATCFYPFPGSSLGAQE